VGLRRELVRGVDLPVVVPAAPQALDLVVVEVLDQLAQTRVPSEEVLADVRPVLDGEPLEVAVERLVHPLQEHPVHVARQQLVPLPAPDDLDDVPAGPAEDRLQLLDDLPVAAHGPVEPLQVAVHDEDEVVEPLARSQGEPGDRLRLVHLAVAEEGPDVRPAGVGQPAGMEVLVEARLVDGVERPEPHRDGRELPEVGHEPGMRIA